MTPAAAGITPQWTNWAGNQRTTATRVVRPASRDGIVAAITAAREEGIAVKAVGSGHSFTPAAVTDGVRIVLDSYAGLVAVDRATREVTVQAGMPVYRLNDILAATGLALPNLGDIDRQTVSGAIATGTHGTGARFGGLATFVSALELVTAEGSVLRCSAEENPAVFHAARIGIGALGVVTEVTLRCEDAFVLHADERPMPLSTVLAELDAQIAANDHYEFYWFPYTDRALVKRNNRQPTDEPVRPLARGRAFLDDELLSNTVFGAICRLGRVVPRLAPTINGISSRALSPRTYSDRSDRVFCSPRRVRFVEMEYAVPRAAIRDAFSDLQRVVERSPVRVMFPVEVRFAAADGIWLSTAYGRDTAYIAVHQYAGMEYEPYFREVEAVMSDLGGRPHWGKIHFLTAETLAPRYPHFSDFLTTRDRLDPHRLFANAYTTRILGP